MAECWWSSKITCAVTRLHQGEACICLFQQGERNCTNPRTGRIRLSWMKCLPDVLWLGYICPVLLKSLVKFTVRSSANCHLDSCRASHVWSTLPFSFRSFSDYFIRIQKKKSGGNYKLPYSWYFFSDIEVLLLQQYRSRSAICLVR